MTAARRREQRHPESPAEYRAGLGIGQLDTPSIEAFLKGLPRRVRSELGTGSEDEESGTGGVEAPTSSAGAEDGGGDEPPFDIEAVAALIDRMADRLDDLIDTFADAGYALEPDIALAGVGSPAPVAGLADSLGRLDAGVTEAVRRMAGIPFSGWGSQPDLIDDARAAVADLSYDLRQIDEAVRS